MDNKFAHVASIQNYDGTGNGIPIGWGWEAIVNPDINTNDTTTRIRKVNDFSEYKVPEGRERFIDLEMFISNNSGIRGIRSEGLLYSLFITAQMFPESYNSLVVTAPPCEQLPNANLSIDEVHSRIHSFIGRYYDNVILPRQAEGKKSLHIMLLPLSRTVLKKLRSGAINNCVGEDRKQAKENPQPQFFRYSQALTDLTETNTHPAYYRPDTDKCKTSWINVDEPYASHTSLQGFTKIDDNFIIAYVLKNLDAEMYISETNTIFSRLFGKTLGLFILENIIPSITEFKADPEAYAQSIAPHIAFISELPSLVNLVDSPDSMNQAGTALSNFANATKMFEIDPDNQIKVYIDTIVAKVLSSPEEIRSKIKGHNDNINAWLRSINKEYEAIAKLEILNASRADYEKATKEAIKDSLNMLSECEYVKAKEFNRTGPNFLIERDVMINDPEMFRTHIVEPARARRDGCAIPLTVLDYVFRNPDKYTLMCAAELQVNIDAKTSEKGSHSNTSVITLNNYRSMLYPQPHIMRYSCFGTYRSLITQAFGNGRFDEVIELTIEACSGINWSDGPVVNFFINYLFDSTIFREKKSIRNEKTGELVTAMDVFEDVIANTDTYTAYNNHMGMLGMSKDTFDALRKKRNESLMPTATVTTTDTAAATATTTA